VEGEDVKEAADAEAAAAAAGGERSEDMLRMVEVQLTVEKGMRELVRQQYNRAIALFTKAIAASRGKVDAATRADIYLRRSQAKYRLVLEGKTRPGRRPSMLGSALRDCDRAGYLARSSSISDEDRAEIFFSRAHLLFHLRRFSEALDAQHYVRCLSQRNAVVSINQEALSKLKYAILDAISDTPDIGASAPNSLAARNKKRRYADAKGDGASEQEDQDAKRGRGGGSANRGFEVAIDQDSRGVSEADSDGLGFSGIESPSTSDDENSGVQKRVPKRIFTGHSNSKSVKSVSFWGPRSDYVLSGYLPCLQ